MDELASRILDERDLRSVLRDLLQRGADLQSGRRMPGLRDLLERLRDRRQQQLDRWNLGSVMDGISQRLDKIVDQERQGIQEKQEAAAAEGLQDMFDRMAQKHL